MDVLKMNTILINLIFSLSQCPLLLEENHSQFILSAHVLYTLLTLASSSKVISSFGYFFLFTGKHFFQILSAILFESPSVYFPNFV